MNFILKFKNYSPLIGDKEVRECLKTLRREYKDMNVDITIFRSKWQVLWTYLYLTFSPFTTAIFWANWNDVKWCWQGTECGCFSSGGMEIYIFPFNYKHKHPKILKIQIIHCILHELQHAHQYVYQSDFYYRNGNTITVDEENYSSQPLEKDANDFSRATIKKHKKKISKIVKFNKWEVIEEEL